MRRPDRACKPVEILMPRSRTRAAARRNNPERRPLDPEWTPARFAQLRRAVMRKIAQFKTTRAYARMAEQAAQVAVAQQKAPDLATGGSAGSDDEDED